MVIDLCDSVSYVLSFVGKEKIGDLCVASSVRIIKYITIDRWLAASAGRREEHRFVLRISVTFISCLMAVSFTFVLQ